MTESLNDLRDAFERPLGFQMCLVGLAALAFGMTSLWLPLGQYDQIIIHSDYPKFYWFTLKQTEWLLEYGSPFGVSPLIHNGMPGFLFLRTGFIFFTPFYLLFGATVGYSIMLCVACMTFSLGVFCILDRVLGIRLFALLFACLTAFGLGLSDYIAVGMTPYILAMAVNVWLLYFVALFYDGQTKALYGAALLAATLVYTHVASLIGIMLPATLIFLWYSKHELQWRSLAKHVACALFIFVCLTLPWFFNYFQLNAFLSHDYLFASDAPSSLGRWLQTHAHQVIGYAGPAPEGVSHTFLLWVMFAVMGPSFYLILLPCILLFMAARLKNNQPTLLPLGVFFFLGFFTWFSIAFGFIPALRLVLQRVTSWLPLISGLLYLSALFTFAEKIKNPWRIGLISMGSIGLLMGLITVRPPVVTPFASVPSAWSIDPQLSQWIQPTDRVLLENCAHVNPAANLGPFETCHQQGHWTGLLSDILNVPIFAHAGDDPHPFVVYRDHYLNSGTFNGQLLTGKPNPDFDTRMQQAQLNKACVITKTARRYFHLHPDWIPMGPSRYYTCYAHQAGPSALWQLKTHTPFSSIWATTGPQQNTKTLPVLNYALWQSSSETTKPMTTRACGDYLCAPQLGPNQTLTLRWPRHLYQWFFIILGLLVALVVFLHREP